MPKVAYFEAKIYSLCVHFFLNGLFLLFQLSGRCRFLVGVESPDLGHKIISK